MYRKRNTSHPFIQDILITLMLLVTSTVLAFIFLILVPTNTGNIALFYTLSVILIARYTDGYAYGVISAMISVICVNYFFTYPFFRLNFTLTGYPVTFVAMLAIALTSSAATTHMKMQAIALAEQEEIVQKAEKEKMRANLLRAVSHDLRTPLTSIIGASSSYIENKDSLNENRKYELIKCIYDDANWLRNMVENLLTITRIQESDTKVKKTLEMVEEVAAEAVLRFKKRYPEAMVNVRIPNEMLLIPMDSTLIEQVINNLLENAFNHSQSKEPIEFFMEDEPDSVSFHVRDFGMGIPPEHLEDIFDGVAQRNSSPSDSKKGMGIGLSICKTIISAHNGSIYALNHDHGAEFIFTLPKEANYES